MIHKFEGIERDANVRENIFVFIDEAHRSVARDLGTYLMAALPHSTIVGFTGTPIAETEYGQGTFKIFGADDARGYLDKPMRDHVLLQAIARVNRPYVDAKGHPKHIGLVVDFVGVLRELTKALRFDSSDISGVIEDL